MSKSIVVDRVKIIAEMARQNLTGEELAQKARCRPQRCYQDAQRAARMAYHRRPRGRSSGRDR